jgi:hypothetical protein
MVESSKTSAEPGGCSPRPEGKRPYLAPKLTVYGDVRTLVLAGTYPFPEDSTSGTPRSRQQGPP